MGKKAKAIGAAGGRIAKMVGDKLNFGTFDAGAAKAIRQASEQTVQRVRRVSKRRKYLGNTPGKASRTGREVIERMRREGKIVTRDGEDYLLWRPPGSPSTQRIPLSQCDMGHHPVNAVDYWNHTGIHHGARSPEVREWMLNPDNYELQPSGFNRSQGAKLNRTYNDPN